MYSIADRKAEKADVYIYQVDEAETDPFDRVAPLQRAPTLQFQTALIDIRRRCSAAQIDKCNAAY